MTNEETIKRLKEVQAEFNENWVDYGGINKAFEKAYKALEERPQGEYVPISKLRLMTVEECAGHTIEYAMGWKACIDWLKKGGADNEHL